MNAILRPTPPPGLTWHPQVADYGIRVDPSTLGYIDMTTDRMIFPPAIEQTLLKQLSGLNVQPTLTYLANTIARGKLEYPIRPSRRSISRTSRRLVPSFPATVRPCPS